MLKAVLFLACETRERLGKQRYEVEAEELDISSSAPLSLSLPFVQHYVCKHVGSQRANVGGRRHSTTAESIQDTRQA